MMDFFFHQQNSPFHHACCFFARHCLFFTRWISFSPPFLTMRVIYSKSSASDRSISLSYHSTFTPHLPLQPPQPQQKQAGPPPPPARPNQPPVPPAPCHVAPVVPAWPPAMNQRLQCPLLAETSPAKARKARNYMLSFSPIGVSFSPGRVSFSHGGVSSSPT